MVSGTAVPNGTLLPVDPLCALLEDVAAVVISLDSQTYVAAPMAPLSGSIGQHVRHLVDHVAAFLQGADAGEDIDYDSRQRGTEVEGDPAAAVAMIYRCSQRLRAMTRRDANDRALVRSQLSRDAEATTSWSTLGREVAFVVSHTIHHQAIIALLLHANVSELPRHFGLAPSTPASH